MSAALPTLALLALSLGTSESPVTPAAGPGASPRLDQAKGRPVDMRARGGLSVDLKKQTGTAHGDVVIQRDDVTVCCDRADALFTKSAIRRVECRGNVVVLRPDGTRARADVAIFDAATDTVTLAGQARVQSSEADLEGESIVYDIASDRLEVKGSKARLRYTPQAGAPLPLGRACPPPPAASSPSPAASPASPASPAASPASPAGAVAPTPAAPPAPRP